MSKLASSRSTLARSTPLTFITCTKPASSEPPPRNSVTSDDSVKSTSPSKNFAVSAHHELCSGRSPLARAASSDSNRTMAMDRPSSVTPDVTPR